MNLKLPFLVLILMGLPFVQVKAQSYIVPDGVTTPVTDTPNTAVNTPTTATAPAPNNDGYVEYNIVASKPPCTNTTCITAQSISNAKHAYVSDSDVKTYVNLLKTPDAETPECAPPTQTGAKINRYTYRDGNVTAKEYNDSFCMNQGCAYFGVEGAERCE